MTIFGGTGIGVPVVAAIAVASWVLSWAVAALAGVGVWVTTIGVIQWVGSGVGGPYCSVCAVARAERVAASKIVCGVGVSVISTKLARVGEGVVVGVAVAVGKGGPVGTGVAVTASAGIGVAVPVVCA